MVLFCPLRLGWLRSRVLWYIVHPRVDLFSNHCPGWLEPLVLPVVGIWSWLSLFCFNFWIAPLKSSYSGAVYTNVLVGVPLSSIVGVVISISDQWKGFAVVSFRALFGGVGDADDIS